MNYKNPFVLLGIILPVFVSPYAYADEPQTHGTVYSLELNTRSSDYYRSSRGAVEIDTGDDIARYQWGGTSCPGKDLDIRRYHYALDALIQYSQNQDMCVTPWSKRGQGGAECLVRFRVEPCVNFDVVH